MASDANQQTEVDKLNKLGLRLSGTRRKVGWSGRRLATRAGIAQATVSRIENGRRVEDANTVEKIIAALPLTAEETESLLTQVQDAYRDECRGRVDTGVSLVGDSTWRWERSAGSVREFQSGMIPRALRLPDYAQATNTFPSRLLDRLGDAGCGFRFVVTEGALRTWPADGAMMPDQLDRVARACEMANVRLGVVPWSVPLPVMPPHGFMVFDDEAVTVETFTAQMTITEPDAVAAYVDAYAQLEAVAVTGDEAAELLARIRRDFEELAH